MRRLALVLLTGALLVGCSEDAFLPETVTGLYNLVNINGNVLPAPATQTIAGETATSTYSAGSVRLNADNTYSSSSTFEFNDEGVSQTFAEAGTYELVKPNTVRFTSSDADIGPLSATLDGNRLTLLVETNNFLFER
jgi:hypothetical protein